MLPRGTVGTRGSGGDDLTSSHDAPRADPRAAAVWTLLLSSSVIYFFSTNAADNDLWGHLLFGRDIIIAGGTVARVDPYAYTTAGHAWVNHEWLSQVLLAAVYRWAGSPGLLFLKLAVATVTFLLLFGLIRRRGAAAAIRGGIGLLTLAVLARGFAFRPQIFTYCAVALVLAVLDHAQHGQRRVLWTLPGIFFLWANLHGGFALGLAILVLFAAWALLGGQPWRQPMMVLVVSTLSTAVNPNGPRLLLYIWNELSRAHPITEWQPPQLADAGQLAFFGLIGLFIATLPFFRRWREQGWQIVLALGMGFLAVRHQRHTPVFAMCAVAPLTAQLDGALRWLGRRTRAHFALSAGSRSVIGLALVALALLQIALCGVRWRRDGLQIVFDPTEYPTAAVRAMRAAGLRANLAVPLDWGEYVLWFLAPQVKVSLDGRFATLFPERVVEDNFDFFSAAPGWRHLLERYPTDAVLVPAGSPCPIAGEPGWRRAYGDPVARLYVRADRADSAHLSATPAEPAAGIFP